MLFENQISRVFITQGGEFLLKKNRCVISLNIDHNQYSTSFRNMKGIMEQLIARVLHVHEISIWCPDRRDD